MATEKKKIIFFGSHEQARQFEKEHQEYDLKNFGSLRDYINSLAGLFDSNGMFYNPDELLPYILAKADAFVITPDWPYLRELYTILAEREVYHPLTQIYDIPHEYVETLASEEAKSLQWQNRKPIVLLGNEQAWQPVTEIFQDLRNKGVLRHSLQEQVKITDNGNEAAKYISVHFSNSSQAVQNINGVRPRSEFMDYAGYLAVRSRYSEYHNAEKGDYAPEYNIGIMGSANPNIAPDIKQAVKELSFAVFDMGYGIVHGGGCSGVMGSVIEAAEEKPGAYLRGISAGPIGAPVLAGFEPNDIARHNRLTQEKDMPARIQAFAKNFDAVVIAPGGIGSLEEMTQMINMRNCNHQAMYYTDEVYRKVPKPIIIFNHNGFYDRVLSMLTDQERRSIVVMDSPADIAKYLQQYFMENTKQNEAFNRLASSKLLPIVQACIH